MKATAWLTFVAVLMLALNLSRQEAVDQRARNFVNVLEARQQGMEANMKMLPKTKTQRLQKMKDALSLERTPSSPPPDQGFWLN